MVSDSKIRQANSKFGRSIVYQERDISFDKYDDKQTVVTDSIDVSAKIEEVDNVETGDLEWEDVGKLPDDALVVRTAYLDVDRESDAFEIDGTVFEIFKEMTVFGRDGEPYKQKFLVKPEHE